MAEAKAKLASVDPVWSRVCDEAVEAIKAEPLMGGMIHSSLLHHATMERALAYRFSLKLASGEMSEQILREIADEAYAVDPDLAQSARADLMAVFERDPACHRFLQPILFFKGFQAVQAYTEAAQVANAVGIGINAGHDLNLENLRFFKDHCPQLLELSIGHALISDALYYGLENTVRMYLRQIA